MSNVLNFLEPNSDWLYITIFSFSIVVAVDTLAQQVYATTLQFIQNWQGPTQRDKLIAAGLPVPEYGPPVFDGNRSPGLHIATLQVTDETTGQGINIIIICHQIHKLIVELVCAVRIHQKDRLVSGPTAIAILQKPDEILSVLVKDPFIDPTIAGIWENQTLKLICSPTWTYFTTFVKDHWVQVHSCSIDKAGHSSGLALVLDPLYPL